MHWILILYLVGPQYGVLNRNVYVGEIKFPSHAACTRAIPAFRKEGYEGYCDNHKPRWLTPKQYNAMRASQIEKNQFDEERADTFKNPDGTCTRTAPSGYNWHAVPCPNNFH